MKHRITQSSIGPTNNTAGYSGTQRDTAGYSGIQQDTAQLKSGLPFRFLSSARRSPHRHQYVLAGPPGGPSASDVSHRQRAQPVLPGDRWFRPVVNIRRWEISAVWHLLLAQQDVDGRGDVEFAVGNMLQQRGLAVSDKEVSNPLLDPPSIRTNPFGPTRP
jgi:hypothetical protein